MKSTHDMIILGAGAGGLTLASGAAQLGMKVVLFEKEHMGGDCLYSGCVPSKTLLKSSLVYFQAGQSESYGLPPLSRPAVDLKAVMSRVDGVIQGISHHDSAERFESLGVEVHQEEASFFSPGEIIAGGQKYSSKRIVVATGSSPAILPIPGLAEAGFLTNKNIFLSGKLPGHLITIGGGPIGVEISQAFSRLGSKVTILIHGRHILSREDEDMALIIQNRLIREGVKIIKNAKISRVETAGNVKKLFYSLDGKDHEITGDEILLAAGRKGNTENLNLDKAGVETDRSYIKTNSRLRSSNKYVSAIGDVNGQYLFTHVAGAEGSFLVKNLVLGIPGHFRYDNVPWCTYSDPELASVGYNEKRAQAEGLFYKTVISPLSEIDRAQAEGETAGMIKILIDRKERVMGTQIAGFHAGDLIQSSLYAIQNKYKLMDLMAPMIPYPTLGEIQKRAAGSYLGPKLFNPRTKSLLKKLYKYRGK